MKKARQKSPIKMVEECNLDQSKQPIISVGGNVVPVKYVVSISAVDEEFFANCLSF